MNRRTKKKEKKNMDIRLSHLGIVTFAFSPDLKCNSFLKFFKSILEIAVSLNKEHLV